MAGRRILFVEDDVDLVESLRTILEDEGISVLVAADGEAALLACNARPDLALVDLHIGGDLSGEPLIQAMRSRLRGWHCPIILVSGAVDLSRCVDALGADGYLEKPFSVDALLRLIDELAPPQHAPRSPAR
jgi:DNA-binding response OmpR family regulator